ncbi:PREDICTED: methylthioribulose-1-phosphate dehydratase-like [Priapulus caudatus]|uniref:Methylthioribulose-1-phosphate dehydratase-like n=1 Tax=Priapulus caudatus TaxID=37621 RepID=A0ABM1DZW0_PRICU|nr:PREDICTED: methylthioribulose-1-phosphate dehydratase-like [Priapulus caudatus]
MRVKDKIYISPSGVLKERIQREDLFVLNLEGEELDVPPPYKKLHRSSCTPNFLNAYTLRKAGSVMHIHSRNAVLATLLYPGSEIRLTHLQMIKGIHNPTTGVNFNYDHEIVIPVIENTREEVGLKVPMAEAMINYPEASAILVRRHGIYVWGDTWKQTKVMLECFEHLLDLAVHMKMAGLNPSEAP